MTITKRDKTNYILESDVKVVTSRYIIKVKRGFLFDGASIPKIARPFVGCPFTGLYTEAALVHDALYSSHILTREDSDDVFLELMKQTNDKKIRMKAMYYAVRLGGHVAWNEAYNENNVQHIELTPL